MPSPFLSPPTRGFLLSIVLVGSYFQLAKSACRRPQVPDYATFVHHGGSNLPNQLPNGYVLRVVCNPLFRLSGGGNGFMRCRNDEWSQTYSCEAICERLQPISRGRVVHLAGGTKARYFCTTNGYRLEGERRRRCMDDGTWSGERPRCRGIPICEQPQTGEHLIQRRISGRFRENLWIVGAILRFTCEENFTPVSETYPAIECGPTGWNATVPVCMEGRCDPLLDTIENGNSSVENRTYAPGEAIKFTCDRGYRTTSPSWRVCIIRRGRGGSLLPQWEGVTPECIETRCSQPRRIENGETIVFSTNIGGKTTFRCRSGYELIGDSEITCQEDGQWNGTMPVCDNGENYCPPLATPLNGYKTGDRYSLHRTVQFDCESGYALSGSSSRDCMRDGQWSGEEAKCMGSLDFDDVNQISTVLRQSLDRLEIDNLFENEIDLSVSNSTGRGRFIPSQHEFGVDLYFLFDASDSVSEDNFEKSKRFAKELVRKIGVTDRPNSLRVGALHFSSADRTAIDFHTVDYHTTDEVINQGINPIPYARGGTDIAGALRLVAGNMISLSDHREGSYRTVFLITDGEATEGGTPEYEAARLKEQGITIHCLGISENANKEQLIGMASKPHKEHVFFLKNYDSLDQLVAKVINDTVDYSECGISSNTALRGRVIGGNDASPGAWPWQVLLDMRKGLRQLLCGGVLIDRNWVLTAAHCLPEDSEYRITAVLGMTDLSKPRHQAIEVEERIPHPEWGSLELSRLDYRNDIALLKLKRPAVFNANVRPVCLPNKTRADKLVPSNPSNRHVATVTGWGHNKTRAVIADSHVLSTVDKLQQLALPMKSTDNCRDSLRGDPELAFFDETMFCAGYENALLGACQGDSGGPLVKKAVHQRQRRWILIGLTSWGRGCAVQNELDFFTNVPYFMDWITQTMNPPQEEEADEEGEGGAEEPAPAES